LARLALQAEQRQEQAPKAAKEGIWLSFHPNATFIDADVCFGPGQDRLEATPEGLPDPDEKALIESVQAAIGTRVDRLLSSFAFEAASRKEKIYPITDGEQFTTPVYEGLLRNLPLQHSKAGPVLARLAQELREAAQQHDLGGDWGSLREQPHGLVLEIAAPLERLPADRPRARVVGGNAQSR
jgi:hypothetical protein